MAKIREVDFETKIRRHHRRNIYILLAIIAVIVIIAAAAVAEYISHNYTTYEISSTLPWEGSSDAVSVRLGDSILTYSNDGAHCTNSRGSVVWNLAFEMQEVMTDVCQDVAVLASYNDTKVYVVSESEILGDFTTYLPIRAVTVSEGGRVVVVMADSNAAYFNTYSSDGSLLFEGQATMSGSGYPMSLSISPSGELLEISYIYLDAGEQKTNIAFYNLGNVGANETDYLVSAYEYTDTLIPYVRFMNNSTAVAVGDSMLLFYDGSQKPVFLSEFSYSDEVIAVYNNEDYLGLVFYAETGESLYRVDVYSSGGNFVGSVYPDIDFSKLFFYRNNIIAYNDSECVIMSLSGDVRYSGDIESGVRLMVPINSLYRYLVVTANSLDVIRLK